MFVLFELVCPLAIIMINTTVKPFWVVIYTMLHRDRKSAVERAANILTDITPGFGPSSKAAPCLYLD